MSNKKLLDIALQEAALANEEKFIKKQAAKREAEENEQTYKRLDKLVNETLDQFDGINGIIRSGNRLYDSHKNIIAKIEVAYETWDDPNYDYRVPCSGIVMHWTIYEKHGRNVLMTGNDLESFAKYVGRYHLVNE